MKRTLRLLVMITAVFVVVAGVRATEEDEESFSKKVRDFFVRTPTPTPRKHKKTTTAPQKKEAPSPSPVVPATPEPTASPSLTPEPSATTKPKTPAATPRPSPSATTKPKTPAATPRPSPSATTKPKTPATTPSPSPSATPKPIPNPTITPKPSETVTPSPSPLAKKNAPNATISQDEIVGYDKYSPEVRKVIEEALSLTSKNLGYKYGSADPANGGMDCSGFIHYVLTKNGMTDVPRDAREQYIWLRKAGTFQAVLGHSDDTFELDGLKPGDLLFWSGTYTVDRDPAITHTMIYLGREKGTNRRIMVGASDGRTYKGQSRFGVSVFDFKVSRLGAKTDDRPGAAFVGYGRIPGLPNG